MKIYSLDPDDQTMKNVLGGTMELAGKTTGVCRILVGET